MLNTNQLIIVSLLLSAMSGKAFAVEAYIGQFLYQYDGGTTYRVTVSDSQTMTWLCVAGAEKGASGIEKPERFKVASKVYFTTWVEKTGINVSQVVDLKRMHVYSTIIDGKERYVLVGKVVREK